MEVSRIWEKSMERKQQIRAELKEKRNLLTKEQREEYSGKICEQIWKYIVSEEAEVIYCYYPLGSEVNVLPLAEKALSEGKKIAFPRTNGDMMEFYPVMSLAGFQKGAFGIMEPIGEVPITEDSPMVIVPGLGFDRSKNRIGYGKGFYDRYFARFPACRKIAATYETQIVDNIPTNDFDTPMDLIITEREVLE